MTLSDFWESFEYWEILAMLSYVEKENEQVKKYNSKNNSSKPKSYGAPQKSSNLTQFILGD